ncbi:MAG: diaminopimelate decarboxylase [Chloroflexi bacterium]|nr:diaminopimelate decarboxylase [Chloroflexota bacterium]
MTAGVNDAGHLTIGGCDATELARQFGTPLYVLDEATIRAQARAYKSAFATHYPDSAVAYASKAYLSLALARLLAEEGLGLDVVSGGELFVAHRAGFPPERVHFHGNNKSPEELAMALELGVGRIVVDNMYELRLLSELAARRGVTVAILLRLSPGVDPHTHAYNTTGLVDSKFGLPIVTGQAEEAVTEALRLPGLRLLGLHAHIGSQILELAPYRQTVATLFDFAAAMYARYGPGATERGTTESPPTFVLAEFGPGGGWGITYTPEQESPTIPAIAETIATAVRQNAARVGLPLPRLFVEPGRSIVGRAGVALYRVGAIKDIPGVRCYVAVDGGMADNMRPALYGARYVALAANHLHEPCTQTVTIAGKYCESGDILIQEAALPPLAAGDLLAIPAAGAYCLALSSNYNLALRPAVVMVCAGMARLIRRRETYDDLLRCEA